MTLKDGFFWGILSGFFVGAIAFGIVTFEQWGLNLTGLSNLSVRLITLFALVFTPIVIWTPKMMNTTKKGFLVGFPWSVAVVGLILEIFSS